jgi:hypothetical protein
MKIFGIHYNWHTHPTVGEVYHHYYIGEAYEAPNRFNMSEVTDIETVGDNEKRVIFANGSDIFVTNINKVFIIPENLQINGVQEQKTD